MLLAQVFALVYRLCNRLHDGSLCARQSASSVTFALISSDKAKVGEATIRDVARRAQVSVATVSRALNQAENVSESARERIAIAVHDLGYVPHAGARSLSLARNNAIGVVLPDLHGEFFSEIVRGMDREASRRGYLLLLSNLHAGSEQATNAMRTLRGRVDGLIVMAPHLDQTQLSAALPGRLPAVLINTRGHLEAAPEIHLDNAAGIRAVVDHLASTGRRRLLHISGPEGNVDAVERMAAFEEAVAANAIEGVVLQGNFDEESGAKAVQSAISSGLAIDAVVAANDNMAIGAIEALRAMGLRVPDDVAVAGFDDIPLAHHLKLTTVRVRIAELGERALQLLMDKLGGGNVGASELHRPELVVRGTTMKSEGSTT